MNRKILIPSALTLSVLASGFALTRYAPSQEPQVQEVDSLIVLDSPREGDTVGREAKVKGTARLPSGKYLWIVVRRHDFEPLWWPQREAKVDPVTHEFEAMASFGENRDIDSDFDLGLITLDEQGHRILKAKWLAAMESGDWKPVRVPATTSPPKVIRVRKVSH